MTCGQLVWSGVSGVKSTSGKQPVSPTTPFILASSTKTVTATMTMTLVQAGRLSLGTPISKFYPSLPDAPQITVRMLLSNTSGLPDYGDNEEISSFVEDPRHQWTTEQIVSALSGMEPQFAPGTESNYNNSNWVVLAGVIQRVSGMPLNSYFEEAIAKPAGMKTSTFAYQPGRSSEFAHPYVKEEDGALSDQFLPGVGISSSTWGPVFGDGGLASTAADLARFSNALFSGRLVSQSTLQQMMQMNADDYGLGLSTRAADGHTWYGHDGSYGGFESENWTDPARHVSITVTANLESPGDDDTGSGPGVAETIWSALASAYDQSPGSHAACR